MFDPKKGGKKRKRRGGKREPSAQWRRPSPKCQNLTLQSKKSNEVKFSKMSGESDLDLMINKQNQKSGDPGENHLEIT